VWHGAELTVGAGLPASRAGKPLASRSPWATTRSRPSMNCCQQQMAPWQFYFPVGCARGMTGT
jgi:hypothetical protein